MGCWSPGPTAMVLSAKNVLKKVDVTGCMLYGVSTFHS
jgi:hypothetical protein